MKSIISAFMIVGCLMYSMDSLAQETESVDTTHKTAVQLNEDGMKFFQQKEYRRAIESFTEAYSVSPDSNLLFNIARCYEKLGEYDAAREKYEIFLKNPGADAEGRLKAQKSLDNIEKLQAEKEKPPLDLDPLENYLFSSNNPMPESVAPKDNQPSTNWLPWVGIGVGVMSAAIGVAVYSSGVHDHDKVMDSRGAGDQSHILFMSRSKADSLVRSGDTKKLEGFLGIGVGAALLTVSGSFLIFSGPSHSVALQVSPEVLGGRLNVAGNF